MVLLHDGARLKTTTGRTGDSLFAVLISNCVLPVMGLCTAIGKKFQAFVWILSLTECTIVGHFAVRTAEVSVPVYKIDFQPGKFNTQALNSSLLHVLQTCIANM